MKTKRNSIGQPFSRLGSINGVVLGIAALVALVAPAARASDPNGIYAFVDKVVFEPNEAAPERIQVWGGFAIAKADDRDSYQTAERGYLYFTIRPGDEEICKKEWADLQSIAGKKQIVTFGTRYEKPPPTVRKLDAKPEHPTVYPKSWGGITKTRVRDYTPINELVKLMEKPSGAKGASSAKPAMLAKESKAAKTRS